MSQGYSRFGMREGAGKMAAMIERGWRQEHPSWVQWTVGRKNARNPAPQGRPYHGAQSPIDDPFTYKNLEQYQMYSPWPNYDARPETEREWRDLLKDPRYTRYHQTTRRRVNDATQVTAGMESRSVAGQKWYEMTAPKHDLKKPLGLLQKQRCMLYDSQRSSSGATRPADCFLEPNVIRRDPNDRSAASARARMDAMKHWRAFHPTTHTFRVSKAAIASSGLVSDRDALEAFPADSLSFEDFLTLYHPPSTYYKLGHHSIPSSRAVTSSTMYPLGYANTGITAYGQGTLATGS